MAFDIKDFLNAESKKELHDDFIIKRLPADKLKHSRKNFYNIDQAEVDALKETIELVGVQENLIVKPIVEDGENTGYYEIISGHKRHTAVKQLIEEGKDVSNLLPCKIEDARDTVKGELILIFTNSTQRERSDYCKMQEIQRVRELLEEYAKVSDLPGRKRDIIAGILNTSKTTIGRLDNIRRNIIPEFMDEYKAGKISTSAANEIAGAPQDAQKELLSRYIETGSIKAKEVAEFKAPEPEPQLPGQMNVADYPNIISENIKEELEAEEPQEIPEKATEVTIKRQQDTTDRKSLIISGKINPNREYNGMNVRYFMDAVANSDIFDNDFWESWTDPAAGENGFKELEQYAGVVSSFASSTGEMCNCYFENKAFVLERKEAQQVACINVNELSDLIDAMILTKVVEVSRPAVDVAYLGKETARELARYAMYLTEDELAVMQDIVLKAKERAGK